MKSFSRTPRISSNIQKGLSEIMMRGEVKAFVHGAKISISRVILAENHASARIYVSSVFYTGSAWEECVAQLNTLSPVVRSCLVVRSW